MQHCNYTCVSSQHVTLYSSVTSLPFTILQVPLADCHAADADARRTANAAAHVHAAAAAATAPKMKVLLMNSMHLLTQHLKDQQLLPIPPPLLLISVRRRRRILQASASQQGRSLVTTLAIHTANVAHLHACTVGFAVRSFRAQRRADLVCNIIAG